MAIVNIIIITIINVDWCDCAMTAHMLMSKQQQPTDGNDTFNAAFKVCSCADDRYTTPLEKEYKDQLMECGRKTGQEQNSGKITKVKVESQCSTMYIAILHC